MRKKQNSIQRWQKNHVKRPYLCIYDTDTQPTVLRRHLCIYAFRYKTILKKIMRITEGQMKWLSLDNLKSIIPTKKVPKLGREEMGDLSIDDSTIFHSIQSILKLTVILIF